MNKNLKIIFVTAFLLVLFASANSVEITGRDISIQVNETLGQANKITEKIYLKINESELTDFQKTIQEKASDFDSWKNYLPSIAPKINFKQENSFERKISFIQEEKKPVLVMEYLLSEKIFIMSETARLKEFALNESYLNNFSSRGLFILESKDSINFELPINAIIENEIEPKAVIQNKTIEWQGPLSTSKINFAFNVKKPITPSFSITQVVENIATQKENIIILIVIIVVVALIYFEKDRVGNKIEGFVVKHSNLKNENPDEGTK